jgi:hypothetical protein
VSPICVVASTLDQSVVPNGMSLICIAITARWFRCA